MVTPLDPTSAAFLLAESRSTPMHVGGLQLFRKPAGAGRDYGRELYEQMRSAPEIAPMFLKHPTRSLATAGQWVWRQDDLFDIDHHVRHSALPKPGRVRELLDLCSRLHGTRLAQERPLWESHVIEGLRDGRIGMYTKIHHSLVDGVSSMRLLQSVLSTDPDQRDMPPPWAPQAARPRRASTSAGGGLPDLAGLSTTAFRSALGIGAEAAGLPGALVKTLTRGARNEAAPVALHAPRTLLNQPITGSRRFAAQDWSITRMRAVGKATGCTINDVVLAMCGGALRSYLADLGGLPDSSLIAMVPVSLHAKSNSGTDGGNAVAAVMVQLGTDIDDPALRLQQIHRSMVDGKEAMSSMTQVQLLAMTALGMSPLVLNPLLKTSGLLVPFNVIISNVPGPRETRYFNGAEMVGMYPLSIPAHGMALNITCTSYADQMGFGLTGCRRTVPHLQRLLAHLDTELRALERAAGI